MTEIEKVALKYLSDLLRKSHKDSEILNEIKGQIKKDRYEDPKVAPHLEDAVGEVLLPHLKDD